MKKLITLLFIFSLCVTQARSQQSVACPCMNPPCSFWQWLGGVVQSVGGAIVEAAETMANAAIDVAHAVTSFMNDGGEQPDGEGFDEPHDGFGWEDTGRWWEPPTNESEFYNPFNDPNAWPADFDDGETSIAEFLEGLYHRYDEEGWNMYDCYGVQGGSAYIDHCGQCVPDAASECQLYQLTAQDQAIWDQMDQEDQQLLNQPPTPCHPTLQLGQYWMFGTFYHWIIQIDFMRTNPGTMIEYFIPNVSESYGRADIAHPSTGRIYEIKPDNPTGLSEGQAKAAAYVAAANANCPNAVPWNPGTGYAARTLQIGHPLYELDVREMAPGVLGYRLKTKTVPEPVVIPQDLLEQMRDLVKKLKNAGNRVREVISQFLDEHPALVTFLKGAAISAAITIIVGTIIEDIYTLGVGVTDDVASFALAWKIIRFARALP